MLALQEKFGHTFSNIDLLVQALTHRTMGARNNERMEFIGDAMLNFEAALLLYENFSDLAEGHMSRVRAGMVRQETLVKIADRIGISEHLRVESVVGTIHKTPAMLADALEAMFAAVYLDAGLEKARRVIRHHMTAVLSNGEAILRKDPKTQLQEYLQARKLIRPVYSIGKENPNSIDHRIEAICEVAALNIVTSGTGATRKQAEAVAAERAMRKCTQK